MDSEKSNEWRLSSLLISLCQEHVKTSSPHHSSEGK